jgi:hypothetical protein
VLLLLSKFTGNCTACCSGDSEQKVFALPYSPHGAQHQSASLSNMDSKLVCKLGHDSKQNKCDLDHANQLQIRTGRAAADSKFKETLNCCELSVGGITVLVAYN